MIIIIITVGISLFEMAFCVEMLLDGINVWRYNNIIAVVYKFSRDLMGKEKQNLHNI